MTLGTAVAAFFVIVPLARQFAEDRLGWNQSGQDALAKLLFFPILLLVLYVLRTLAAKRRDRPPE